MIRFRLTGLIVPIVLYCQISIAGPGQQLRLPSILGDGAVIQRGVPVPIWGWAAPGEKVEVRLENQLKSAIAQPDGSWRLAACLGAGRFPVLCRPAAWLRSRQRRRGR